MSRTAAACVLALTFALTSCAASGGVSVQLDEYTLSTDEASVPAGEVTFTGRNVGSIVHQLLVLRTNVKPDDLPVKSGVVQIDNERVRSVGEIELISPDDAETLTIDLAPGPYVLLCNIASHYDNGMRAPFTVSEATTPGG